MRLGKIQIKVNRQLDTSIVTQVICHLCGNYLREQLRELARLRGVPRGRNKVDTIHNLIDYRCIQVITEISSPLRV